MSDLTTAQKCVKSWRTKYKAGKFVAPYRLTDAELFEKCFPFPAFAPQMTPSEFAGLFREEYDAECVRERAELAKKEAP